jgi:serine/threonine protein kinase
MGRHDLLIGTELAGHRIESLIGRGGMGSVYLAEQIGLGRRVALKILAPELAASENFRLRFERESRLAASLDHPHIVPIFQSGEADGVLFIAMRYVDGTDLATLLETEGALSLEEAAGLITQVGSALDAAHARGLVHRDVKPGNVLIARTEPDEERYAYLSDFGLTRLTSSDSALTRTGQFMGTVAYAAPEQFEGKPADAMTDLYSLGCVAYECLTGERPFPRDQEAAVMFAHLQQPPPAVTGKRPDAPAALDDVLARAMAKVPSERFPSGKALGRALRAAVGASTPPHGIPAGASTPRSAPLPDPAPPADSAPPAGVSAPPAAPLPGSAPPEEPAAHGLAGSSAASAGPEATPRAPSDLTVASLPTPRPDRDRASDAAPPTDSAPPAGTGEGRASPLRRRRVVAAAVAAAVVVGAAVAVVSLWHGSGRPSRSPSAGSSGHPTASASGAPPGAPIRVDTMVKLDPATGRVLAGYPVGSNPQSVTFSGHAVWVLNAGDETISKVDAATGHVTTRGGIPSPCALFPDPGGGIWVGDCDDGEVFLVDPISFDIVRTLHVPSPGEVLSAFGSLWVVSSRGPGEKSLLYRFTRSGRLVTRITLGMGSWYVVEEGADLWGNDFGDGTIWRVDPATNHVELIPGWTGPDNVVSGGGSLWISDGQAHTVTQWDTARRQTVGLVRDHSGAIAVSPDAVWIQNSGPDTLARVDPGTDQVVREFQLAYSSDMVFGDGALWISAGSD